MIKRTRTTPDWTGALCAQVDPEMFFPDQEKIINAYNAKRICRECPLKQECFDYAIIRPELKGVWGGTSERDRWLIRSGRKSA